MKANFSKKTVLGIVLKVRQYGELYVATDGSMFKSEKSAESILRTKNMIIGEPDDYLGYVKITKEMVTDARLAVFAKDLNEFNKLFDSAKIPRMRTVEAVNKPRAYAQKHLDKAEDVAKLESLLGITSLLQENNEDGSENKTGIENK